MMLSFCFCYHQYTCHSDHIPIAKYEVPLMFFVILFHFEPLYETLIYRKSYYEITYDEFMNEDSIASYVEGKLKKWHFEGVHSGGG